MMSYTPAQQKAIYLSGNSLLVSAAAGAGKTSVLTERVLRILSDTENPCDADKLMILTFTEAAADEMRKRIIDALREAVAKDRKNAHLKRQLSLVPCAKISTIDSACLDIIRRNIGVLGIDPQFSVLDKNKDDLMKSEQLTEFLEQLYERADSDSEIREVITYFTDGKTDNGLFDALMCGSEYLQTEPWPEEYIEKVCAMPSDNIFESIPNLQSVICKRLEYICNGFEKVRNIALSTNCDKLCDVYETETPAIKKTFDFCISGDFDGAVIAANEVVFVRHPAHYAKYGDIKKEWQQCQAIRNKLKPLFFKIRENFLFASSKILLDDRRTELKVIKKYLHLCNEFNNVLLEKRRRLRYITFNDMEKYALSLLVKNSSGEKTELAKELSKELFEIIVDEYQDCNRLQESIFNALSKDGKNIFTVGDVKQSIYCFRGAEPTLFLQKQTDSVYPDGDTLTLPSKLNLSHNFRSHPLILDFVNRVFDPIMTESRGGIDYQKEHRLESGGLYGDTDKAGVDITFVVPSGKPDAASKTQLEAECVAKRIKSLIGNETFYDVKKKCVRTVTAGDIAILMSAPKKRGAFYEKALENEGIGCINNNPSEKYLDTPEVRDLLAFLQVIDNPYNDIPLVTLMCSEYFGFNAEELGAVRNGRKNMMFYDAVREYAKTDEKTQAFVNRIESLRSLSLTTDVYGIISAVYESSGILLRLASKKGGESQRANLLLLADFASDFESSRYKGLFAFVNYILKLTDKSSAMPAAKLRKSDGCVNILSIHHSKGLEYPVVFLVNTDDLLAYPERNNVLFSSASVGTRIKDAAAHRRYSSIFRNIIMWEKDLEEMYEDMRLLYVALTRARARLYITACSGIEQLRKTVLDVYNADAVPDDADVETHATFMKWMLFSILKSSNASKLCEIADVLPNPVTDTAFTVNIEMCSDEKEEVAAQICRSDVTVDTETVKSNIERKYKFEADTLVPAKMSVSEIKQKKGTVSVSKTPRFMQGGVEGRDRGNATHAFLQFCNFDNITDQVSLENEIARLLSKDFISSNDASLIDRQKTLRFLTSDTMRELSKDALCRKEERFVFGIPANEILDTESTESVTVQGIIDCMYVKDGFVTIVDYKTDRVQDEKTLIDRYAVQLDIYARALFETEGLKTSKKLIYSFSLEKFIEV